MSKLSEQIAALESECAALRAERDSLRAPKPDAEKLPEPKWCGDYFKSNSGLVIGRVWSHENYYRSSFIALSAWNRRAPSQPDAVTRVLVEAAISYRLSDQRNEGA